MKKSRETSLITVKGIGYVTTNYSLSIEYVDGVKLVKPVIIIPHIQNVRIVETFVSTGNQFHLMTDKLIITDGEMEYSIRYATPVDNNSGAVDFATILFIGNDITVTVKRIGDSISIAKKTVGSDRLEYLYQ